MRTLQSETELETIILEGKTVLLFSADWCPDCRVIEPFLPELEEKYADITFVYVDRDKFIDTCIKYDIFGIPSFLAFEDGNEVGRFVSKNRKSREEVEAFLNKI
ncbi:thioredoxin-like protein YtpP [Paraliobacillus quinghaiensis]|uniref:Thioredoxin-like protein YtpP n=1 Tax=Paraliobacillus quinghaiensis TaxID=470815 RepID=A0A917TK21_9BACI|nr:thioredoxin family protein [Paraliobacillus quinghaiensis]GGM26339.1 thioredoxin-like protein YtpP [Paraliobacillus quinghaiensis]